MEYALITGASRGIGKAIARRLASRYTVVLNFKSNADKANELLGEIAEAGGRAELLPFDVSDPQATEAAIDQWEESHEGEWISVLVNNAGIRRDGPMYMMSDDDWHSVLDVNMNAFFHITRRLLKHIMPRGRGGRIVNIASLSGLKGMPGQTNYSAAKAALIGATKALAQEVAARNITVNAVAPGFIATDMTADLPAELAKTVPMRRFGTPEEVAALVDFLVSSEASYITGEVININGGLYS